jgi:hypothetical protein
MGFADILDEAMDLYKKNFVLLAGIGAFLYVPLALLQFASKSPSPQTMESNPMVMVGYGLRVIAAGSIYWLAAMVVTGALTFATSELYLGRNTTVLACYRRVAKPSVFFSFLLANLLCGCLVAAASVVPIVCLAGGGLSFGLGGSNPGPGMVLGILLIFVGLGAFVVPIYVTTRLAVYTPAFFVESHGAWPALTRSWALLKGKVLSTFGILTVVSIVISVISFIILSPLYVPIMMASMRNTEPSPVIMTIYTLLASALSAVTMPIQCLVIILIYYDVRIRREGFDLEMLASDMGERIERVVGQGPPPLPEEITQQVAANPEPPEPGEKR